MILLKKEEYVFNNSAPLSLKANLEYHDFNATYQLARKLMKSKWSLQS